MEENTKMTEQTQAENMGSESEAQGTDQAGDGSGKGQKLFTQEEVNSFVQSRIARMKGQIEKESKAEYTQKLAELESREMKLLVKERLSDRGMPKELADIITCADEKDLDSKLEALQKIYGNKTEEKEKPMSGFRPLSKGFMQVGAPYRDHHDYEPSDPVRKAMGLE
ncbi:hypothetical protein [Clostridium sp. FS41]|uniref:hypothetical protein n=1 Tax=Clostridium sp. FS41 TaxID=1609975 RepID=UPI0005D2ED5A|nr:hypothetical protein [Clostridium sp. FS41]KJJ71708.1 hypothetical protein CLFS41_23700 [Clostridium sp. FS41]